MALSNKPLSPTCAPGLGDIATCFLKKNISIRYRNMRYNCDVVDVLDIAHGCGQRTPRRRSAHIAEQVRHKCGTSAAQARHKCGTSAEQVRHKCGTSAAQVRHKCGTSAAQVRHKCGSSADQVRIKCGAQCGSRAERRRMCGAASSGKTPPQKHKNTPPQRTLASLRLAARRPPRLWMAGAAREKQKAGAPWRYFALHKRRVRRGGISLCALGFFSGDFVNALDQWYMMARAAGRRWLSVALVATRNEQASCLSTTIPFYLLVVGGPCKAYAGPSRALRRMAGLVFLLVFWVLAGACQRHGVGGFLLCNSSSPCRAIAKETGSWLLK